MTGSSVPAIPAVRRLVVAGAVLTALAGWDPGASAAWASPRVPAAADVNFTAAAAAPILQATEDEPNAQFHPEGEGEIGYTLVTADNGSANALATVVWPGSAVGNAGTLATLLGGPSSLSVLNDPVQASAASGTNRTHSSISAPSGSTMTASVEPQSPTDDHSTATTTLARGALGAAGSIGAGTSTSTIDLDSATGVLTVTAGSRATNVDIAGVVKVGSVQSTASARAANGGSPRLQGSTLFHRMSIAGQAAYVDSYGVHVGAPGSPAGPAAIESVDSALSSAGMEVYFTAPHRVTVGGTSYFYSASVLFYWVPPGDPSHNSFTMSLGGAAVSVTDSALAGWSGNSLGGISTSTGSAGAGSTPVNTSGPGAGGPVSSSPGTSPDLAGLASTPSSGIGAAGGATLSLPAPPAAAISSTAGGGGSTLRAAARLPGGIGAGWWVLLAIAGLAGAALTSRIPGLLNRQAAAVCPRARNPRSSFGRPEGRA